MSIFPSALDSFPVLGVQDTAYASTVNNYQNSIVACQSHLESMLSKNNAANEKVLGLTYKVQAVAMPKWYGNEPERTPRLPDELAENRSSAFCSYGPYSGSNSFVTLTIPNNPSIIPNSQSFHAKNKHFVTVECQSFANVSNVRESIFENESYGERKVGGPYVREGLLYHNGTTDLNPKYVLTDWTPLIIDNRNLQQFYTIYTFFIHLVIIG